MADSQRKTANLYNINAKDANNGYIDSTQLNQDGSTEVYPPCEVTEYIEVEPNSMYTLSKFGSFNTLAYCIYDENKQYISGEKYGGQTVKSIAVPSNGKYVRFSHYKTQLYTMLNEGSTVLPYEPYWQHSLRKLTSDGWIDAEVKAYVSATTIADWESVSILQMENYTIQELQGSNWI